jgi:hypothetical protein
LISMLWSLSVRAAGNRVKELAVPYGFLESGHPCTGGMMYKIIRNMWNYIQGYYPQRDTLLAHSVRAEQARTLEHGVVP